MAANLHRLTDAQRKDLSDLLAWGLLEIRQLGACGKAQQAADLADAFHNLPRGMWSDHFSLQVLRDDFLAPYQTKYPDSRVKDYVAIVEGIMRREAPNT